MANIARVTQSFIVAAALQNGVARVTQSFIVLGVGLGINCGNPPFGKVGFPYTNTFLAGGGTPPLAFSLQAGQFPPGLSLNPATGQLSGIPSLAGSYTFTIQVADAMFSLASVTCSIVIGGSAPTGGGGRHGALCGNALNQFDWCMFQQALKLRDIKFPPMCSIPEKYRSRYPLPWGEDFGLNAIPEQAAPLHKVGAVPTPATAAGDVVVLQERVPYGYDGLLAGFFTGYSGQGFEQGSGDIVWRLQINQRYVEALGNLPYAIGSTVSPCPLTEGQVLFSGQLVRLLVYVPNLSGNIQIGNSRILGGLMGFYWPR